MIGRCGIECFNIKRRRERERGEKVGYVDVIIIVVMEKLEIKNG